MKYIKSFESIRDEYADMFAHRNPKDEPQPVPGFEDGTIDPDDDIPWSEEQWHILGEPDMKNKTNDKEIYEKIFIPLTKKRNFQDTEDEIIINMKRLWHDFYMSISDSKRHYQRFLRTELIGKYISKGFRDIMIDDQNYEGIIEGITFEFDGDSCYIVFKLKDQPKKYYGFCENFITLDKMKETANKYNL